MAFSRLVVGLSISHQLTATSGCSSRIYTSKFKKRRDVVKLSKRKKTAQSMRKTTIICFTGQYE